MINYNRNINLPVSPELELEIDTIVRTAIILKEQLNISLTDALKVIEIAYQNKAKA